MKRIKIEFNAKLPICIKQEEGYFISHCPVLDVYSQGDNKEEAKKNLGEALSLFFMSCFERGTLDAVLKESGFQSAKPYKKPIPSNEDYIDVPIPFSVAQSSREHLCRV